MKCIIVDDEPIARKILEEFVADIDFLQLIGTAEHPIQALSFLAEQPADLMFLDIQMPKINGLRFLQSVKNLPLTIMTTAYPEYALEGFELDVVDYLVKPIAFSRFFKACTKAKEIWEYRNTPSAANSSTDYFFVKSNNSYEKIRYDELLYAEAANNYVILHLTNRQCIVYLTFSGLLEYLPAQQFLRVHKSFIVSLSKIDKIDAETISIGKHSIPISRSFREEVLDTIVNRHLIRRS